MYFRVSIKIIVLVVVMLVLISCSKSEMQLFYKSEMQLYMDDMVILDRYTDSSYKFVKVFDEMALVNSNTLTIKEKKAHLRNAQKVTNEVLAETIETLDAIHKIIPPKQCISTHVATIAILQDNLQAYDSIKRFLNLSLSDNVTQRSYELAYFELDEASDLLRKSDREKVKLLGIMQDDKCLI